MIDSVLVGFTGEGGLNFSVDIPCVPRVKEIVNFYDHEARSVKTYQVKGVSYAFHDPEHIFTIIVVLENKVEGEYVPDDNQYKEV